VRDRESFQRELLEVSPPPPPAAPAKPAPVGSKTVTPAVGAWSILIVDADNKPIDGEPYLAYQPGIDAPGTLKNGRADMGKLKPQEPFRFEVRGRVCSIKEGAVLMADDPAIQYGGTVVDWSEADAPNADQVFWPQYTKYRTTPFDGPSTFIQHEHLTRRQIKLRASYAAGTGKTAVLSAWPVRIRVGPLVRFVNADTALIWIETRTPAMVRVRFDKKANGRASLRDRYASSVRVGGRHYCVVELDKLSEDTLFEYTVELASQPAAGGILIEQAHLKDAFPKLSQAMLDAMKTQLKGASFNGTEWLTFRTLRTHYDQLRFAYGSCRKYPDNDQTVNAQGIVDNAGPDTLLDLYKFMAPQPPDQWPRFMLLVGDQIYADDVGHKQGLAIGRQRWGRRIPGPKTNDGDGAWAGRFASRYTGVTNAPRNQKYRIDNHLLWHIPVDAKNTHIGSLYPQPDPKTGELPKGKKEDQPAGDAKAPKHPELAPNGQSLPIHAADFAEYAFLYESAWARGEPIRKIFANVPTFMIFDDHEVTDDWNADKRWVENVHRPPKGAPEYWPEAMADALAAYWMYQGWGNQSPADWATDQRSSLLVTHMKAGTDALPALRTLLRRHLEPPGALNWDFALPIASPIFYATDCRMKRVLQPRKPSFDDRVLDRAGLDKMRALLMRSTAPVTFMIASTPLLLPGLIGESFTYDRAGLKVLGLFWLKLKGLFDATQDFDEAFRRKNDMEHWVANQSWYDILRFLADLSKDAPNLKTVVALSGDVHFSYNMVGRLDPKHDVSKKLNLQPPRLDKKGRAFPYLLQLVSSGMKQQLKKEKAYAVRILVEDDSVIGKETPPDKEMKKLRTLSRGAFYTANRLWSPKYVKDDYDFAGLNMRVGGFENFDRRRAILAENSVAVVDVTIDAKAATFKIVEQYVTNKGVPKYTYAMTPAGETQTVPKFP
jgi:hypothetical protein